MLMHKNSPWSRWRDGKLNWDEVPPWFVSESGAWVELEFISGVWIEDEEEVECTMFASRSPIHVYVCIHIWRCVIVSFLQQLIVTSFVIKD